MYFLKRIIYLPVVIALVFTLFSCDENSTNPAVESYSASIWATHSNYYYDFSTGERHEKANTYLRGDLLAVPFPEFDYLKLSDKKYYMHEVDKGGISFGYDNTTGQNVRILEDYNPLKVEVKTSLGKLSGTIALPDTLSDFQVKDSIGIGEAFKVSWGQSNADYIDFSAVYAWEDEEGDRYSKRLDTILTKDMVEFPGSIFNHKGYIDYLKAYPINGPLQKANSVGNLTGDGSGFLFYINVSAESEYHPKEIKVGAGISKTSQDPISEKEITQKIISKMNMKFGIN
jgi:hypothetical protein